MKAGRHLCLLGAVLLASGHGLCGQIPPPLEWHIVANLAVSIRGLAHKAGHFVAVGVTTNIFASTNGTDWILANSGLTNRYFDGLLAVAEGAGQFVAVGSGGTILSSPDGLQWMRRRTGLPRPYEELWAVTYGGGRFVAVGFENPGGAIAATSPDGIQWEKFSVPINTTPRNVAYGQGRYVAVGSPVSMYSTNGRDWTPLNGVLAQGVAFGGGQFVASTSTWNPDGYQSSNGVDWTEITLPALGPGYYGNYYTAAYANGLFMVGGWCDECPNVNRPSLLATSADGRQWTSHVFGADASIGPIRDIVFVDGSFYLGDQSGKVWKSDPTAPVSRPVATHILHQGGQTTLSFATVAGFHYVVECADHLDSATWRRCLGPLFATGDQLSATDPDATSRTRFYRVRAE